jgi:hypothetical protein
MMMVMWCVIAVRGRVGLIDGRRMRGHWEDMKLKMQLALRLSVLSTP